MTDLWFDDDQGRISRRGGMLYVARPDGVMAVLVTDRTFASDLAQESAELLGLYGAAAHGIGHLLLGDEIRLPRDLEQWATTPNVPAAQLGGWYPVLISIDGKACLALARSFESHCVYATTLGDSHLTVLAPTDCPVILRASYSLNAPPREWDRHGGTQPK